METSKIVLETILKYNDILELDEQGLLALIEKHEEQLNNVRGEEEYRKILQAIEMASIGIYYKAQGFSCGKIEVRFIRERAKQKTKISDFLLAMRYDLPSRLYSALSDMETSKNIKYIEDVTVAELRDYRNIGRAVIEKFIFFKERFYNENT